MDQDDRRDTVNRIDGDVIGPSVQAGTIQGGVHFHMDGKETGGAVRNSVDSCPAPPWSALPELPPEIQSLMHAQVLAARELPYRLPGARRPSLATVYVRQDLGNAMEESQPEHLRPTPSLDDHGRIVDVSKVPTVRAAVRPPARTVREALDSDRHLLVTGGPGQGKSTLSLRLAADVATRWDTPGGTDLPLADPVVPLRLTARELATRLDLPFAQALAESAHTEYGALLRFPLDPDALSGSVAGCPWILLVDGLDEVADSVDRDRLVTVLSGWASDAPGTPYRVVLTTRPIEGAALAPLQRIGAARYELQPFDDEALRRFADNWFAEVGPDAAQRFLREIYEAHLDELVKVPLLATIAAIVFEKHGDRPLPDNQYELYEAYLEFLASARAGIPSPFAPQRTSLLEHLGRARLETDTSLIAAARDWTRQNVPAADLMPGWPERLTEFLASTGPLVVRGQDLSFLHHSFAEHLAATAIARTLPERFDPDHDRFENLLHSAVPKETGRHARAVLLHYTRLRPAEADPVLRRLHAGGADQHLLAARLLARHIPAGPDAVDAFLVTVHGWAMATQYAGEEILRQTARASHHPGLTTWLHALMCDPNAPWRSRGEAASALAVRLRGDHGSQAITLLTRVVDDPTIPIDHRLPAAEALADCGTPEREAAERGLRAVLRDPLASGENCRTAAVVLSAFGGQARTDAVAALSQMVDDPDTPTDDLVEAATGLVEIGIEFHERCADAFRAVLHDPVESVSGRRDAALGLASLGPQHLEDAVNALTARATDRRLGVQFRAVDAEVLGELGPQYRLASGELLFSILEEPRDRSFPRYVLAPRLSELGPEFREGVVATFRLMFADHEANSNNVLWSARWLADLGPEFRGEATQQLWKVHGDPLTNGRDRVLALEQLIRIGAEPDRQHALDCLRTVMSDPAEAPMDRCLAAGGLLDAGPEFHTEAGEHLQALTECHLDVETAAKAWRALLKLGTTFEAQAFAALSDLMCQEGPGGGIPDDAAVALTSSNTEHIELAAKVMMTVLTDETRSYRVRCQASRHLMTLGRRYHRRAVQVLRDVLLSSPDPSQNFTFSINGWTGAGTGVRTYLGDALRDVLFNPRSPSARRWKAAQAMTSLGVDLGSEAVPVLQTIMNDASTSPHVRDNAAIAMARMDPGCLDTVVTHVLQPHDQLWLYSWRTAVLDLVNLGADVVPRLRAMLTDDDLYFAMRGAAAALLDVLRSDIPVDLVAARTELARQADDEHLPLPWRSETWTNLAQTNPTAVERAASHYSDVFEDTDEGMSNRVSAARHLARLDRSRARQVLEFLRRAAEDAQLSPSERSASIEYLYELHSWDRDVLTPLIVAEIHNPWTNHQARTRLIPMLPRKTRTEAERGLLADHSIPIEDRLPHRDAWGDLPLAMEAETEIRDTLTAIESRPAERVDAAAALAELSWQLTPEAVSLLENLVEQQCAPDRARRKLAGLGHEPRQDVLTRAETVVRDDSQSRRVRYRAAVLVMDLTIDPPPCVTDFVREVASDEQTSNRDRVDALFALRHTDGLSGLRALRDDERQAPAARWRAAEMLFDRAVEDRATGLRVLHGIATDTAAKPALRWRVAQSLARLGVPGRHRATAILHTMLRDTTLPITARANAARVLVDITASGRRDILRVLRGLLATPNALHRLHAIRAIGVLDASAAAGELRTMIGNERIGVVARLRCAEALVQLRRDQRETAALAARAIAWDESIPAQIRRHAASDLARWSDLCRAEARELIDILRPDDGTI